MERTRALLADKVKLGDYISYIPPSRDITLFPQYHNISSVVSISPSELREWRVLRRNDNGTVDLVAWDVASYVDFKSKYDDTIDTLNIIADYYIDDNFALSARSISKADWSQLDSVFGTYRVKSKNLYWIDTSNKGGCLECIRNGNFSGSDAAIYCGSTLLSGGYDIYIRPVVVLKSTLKITGGNGTESSPYTLGI